MSPRRVKNVKKDLSRTKSNKFTIWMLECWNWIPRLVYPLAWMGFSFRTLTFKLWICLILFRTCLPQIQIFGGIAMYNNSVSFTDRSSNFSPISLKNYFLNFEKNIFWNFWDFFLEAILFWPWNVNKILECVIILVSVPLSKDGRWAILSVLLSLTDTLVSDTKYWYWYQWRSNSDASIGGTSRWTNEKSGGYWMDNRKRSGAVWACARSRGWFRRR